MTQFSIEHEITIADGERLLSLQLELARAEKHIAEGARYIVRQREIIGKLEGGKRDATVERRQLATFEEMQLIHIRYRDRLLNALLEYSI